MEYQKLKLSEYNRLYKDHKNDIDKLSATLKQELPNLCADLELDATAMSRCFEYISDNGMNLELSRLILFSIALLLEEIS